jgi:hypothetical protein
MGQGAGSRVVTGRFQAMGQTGFNLYGVPTVPGLAMPMGLKRPPPGYPTSVPVHVT